MRTNSVILHAFVGMSSLLVAANSYALGISLPAAATTNASVSSTGGIVTLRDAAASQEQAKTATEPVLQKASARPTDAATAVPTATSMPAQTTPPVAAITNTQPVGPVPLPGPLPMPSIIGQAKAIPDITLLRISTRNGVQKASMRVKGLTRSGLTVGDKVLKKVLSEFRDDGVCLDTSLHKPKCEVFVPFAYD